MLNSVVSVPFLPLRQPPLGRIILKISPRGLLEDKIVPLQNVEAGNAKTAEISYKPRLPGVCAGLTVG